MPLTNGQGHAKSTTAIVEGLHMFALHHLVYLSGDQCRATFDATPKTKDERELQAQARAAGWTGPLTRDSNSDKCPTCSGNPP